ncbi:anhydro-N-acetylmuramic acid kinase [Octadecabacter sp. R77987]|uniref:anhydro-N-acetylmuramic acid kinase n=1 Tax=Octadecabacter sp. R77987 TaxID=3093874 RepID=UPI00366F2431
MLKSGTVRALGAMSGTSLDGVDVAVIDTDGHSISGFGDTGYHPYSKAERTVLHGALGQWQSQVGDDVIALIEDTHVTAMAGFEGVDLAGFHGQTLAHDPGGRGTHQAGDGQRIANRLGLPVVWDFRSADVRLGGQGAPLAPFYHFALAKWIGADGPVAFLNLGGVGNLTWVDPSKPVPESDGALLAFDTGPANAPINDLMQQRLGQPYDKDGELAARGTVVTGALELFLDDPYFYKMPPKSLDRNAFDQMLDLVRELDDADAAATMTGMAASAVMRAMEHCPAPPDRVLVCGGGRKNPTMMAMLQAGLDCPVQPVEDAGLDGDMIEAQAFAYLAVRVAKGLPTSCTSTTGVRAAVGGGILSRPD